MTPFSLNHFSSILYIPFTSSSQFTNKETLSLSIVQSPNSSKPFKFNSSVYSFPCKMSIFSPVFSLILLFTQLIIGADADYHANTIFLNCGGPPVATDNYGRQWTTDVGSKFASPGGGNSTTSPATIDPAVPAVPYMTARVFRSPFTYTFPVSPGQISLSLYFYRSSYSGLNISNALFTVKTQSSTLLNNFSPAMEDTQYYGCIVKEYLFNVEGSKLSMTFTPASASNYAFVNGIEVVSYSATPGPIPQPQQGGTDDEPLNSNSKDKKKIGKSSATDIALLLPTLVLLVLVN